MKTILRRIGNAALDLLFPRRCPFCERLLDDGEEPVCSTCQRELPWQIGEQSRRKGEFFTVCVAPLIYQDTVRLSHHRYKFGGRRCYAVPYATLMAQCVQDELSDPFDLVTWVPLSRRRFRGRGYDQARLLAERTATLLGVDCVPALDKLRHTPAQSGLSDAAARRGNVLGAYSVCPDAEVAGRRILLVDDVMTTGATLSECARVLRAAGATQVCCAALAHSARDK